MINSNRYMYVAEYRRAVLATENAWRNVLDAVTEGAREDIDNARDEFETRVRDEVHALNELI